METFIQQKEMDNTDGYIVGNRKPNPIHCLQVGRFYALDGSLGAPVLIDVSKPHVVLIVGKRGYGKSYTLGVLSEEFSRLDTASKKRYSCVIIDTLGIYWTMAYPNTKQTESLAKWNIKPDKIKITVFQTLDLTQTDTIQNQNKKILQIAPHLLSIEQWCDLLQLSIIQPEAILLSDTLINLQTKKKTYSISDIIIESKRNKKQKKETILTIETLLKQVKNWNIFSKDADPIESLIKPGEITIIDISNIHSTHLKQSITGIIAELLFYYRIHQRRKEEISLINNERNRDQKPFIYLAVDEAHLFLPKDESIYVKKILLENWLRQGRQPGLSVILATQRPSFMDPEVLSHSDLVLCHRMTANEDIESLTKIRPSYMKTDIKTTLKKIESEKGVALLIDDIMESTHIIKIRPRYSWHGGDEPDEKIQMQGSNEADY